MERSNMQRTRLSFGGCTQWNRLKLVVGAIFSMACFATLCIAQQAGQKTFSSAEDASSGLVTAVENNDEKAMIEILGPEGKKVISSGDEVEDARARASFVQVYREMHRLVPEPDGTMNLYIGAKNWVTPIPLASKNGSWYFDTAAGAREILYRRIGRNEMSTIRVCQELVVAQKEFYATQGSAYAQKILSDEGQHNGLYWRAPASEPQSPIGPLIAAAVTEGYARRADGASTPYRGYYYRVLTRQGKGGLGGAKNYVQNGKLTGGFAFLAYPAEYRSSGVMTFIVSQDAVVYQRDLGKKTADLARALKEYNPDSSWEKAEDQQATMADGPNPK
jgi:hypothetical protein